MSSAQHQHEALDYVMAAWAMHTRGLFSQHCVAELDEFVNRDEKPAPPPIRENFNELLDHWMHAGLSMQLPITDLMVWSWERVKAEMPQ